MRITATRSNQRSVKPLSWATIEDGQRNLTNGNFLFLVHHCNKIFLTVPLLLVTSTDTTFLSTVKNLPDCDRNDEP